jgi:hypothetical protein
VPTKAAEYCCERACYNEVGCSEGSAFTEFGQWSADVFGRYPPTDEKAVKVSVVSRNSIPDFDPFRFGAAQAAKPDSERKRLRVTGYLKQVLAARPVWIIVVRGPADLEPGGSCPSEHRAQDR